MRSSLPTPPTPVDSIVINELPSQKPTTALLHNYHGHSHHHLYNYWTLNDRLRTKNEQLSKRQQSSCRIAFYSLWLCISACVLCIIVYRFTDECPMTSTNQRKQLIVVKCLRHGLFLAAICIGILSCSGVIFGACRYFRSQPELHPFNDEHELHLTHNYNLLSNTNPRSCCCQRSSANSAGILPFHQTQNHDDERSNATVSSSLPNISPRRKVPPFTYEELPPVQTQSYALPPLATAHINAKSAHKRNNKIAFVSSSNSSSSSPHSVLSTTTTSNATNGSRFINNNHNGKAMVVFEDASASTPTSYTTCVCGTDVWERQQKSTISTPPRRTFASL